MSQQNVGEKLRKRREELGLSLDDLAPKSGLTRDHLGRIERGEIQNPGMNTIVNIAKALGIEISDLFDTDAA